MSGILDSKTRIFDTIITAAGRRQLADGGLDIAYASFTDATAFYAPDAASGSADATVRIYLEACSLPQDDVTFKSNDAGRLQPFGSSVTSSLKNGQLLSYSFNATTSSVIVGSQSSVDVLSGTIFSSESNELLVSSAENFSKIMVIGTHDDVFDDGFAVSPNNANFSVNEKNPISFNKRLININNLESLFIDPRLSNLKNFRYLPPVSKISDDNIDKSNPKNTKEFMLGDYPAAGIKTPLDGATIGAELKKIETNGLMKSLIIDPTSKMNSFIGQMFEINDSAVSKLDIINFGKTKINNVFKHVFFLGKIVIDDGDVQKFVHLFTLVFE